jgi:hypothetical protein
MLQCQDVPSKLLKRRVQQQAQVLKFAFLSRGDGWKKTTHIHNAGMCELPMCDKFGKDAVDSELASGCPKTSKSI